MVSEKAMGSWRGRAPSEAEWALLADCPCPACVRYGVAGLRADALAGFCNRAAHNLWTVLEEAREIKTHLATGTYADWYQGHLSNSIYLPLIRSALNSRAQPSQTRLAGQRPQDNAGLLSRAPARGEADRGGSLPMP